MGKVGLEWQVAKVQTGELGSRVSGWAAQPSALWPAGLPAFKSFITGLSFH